jgi:hypothetical protein
MVCAGQQGSHVPTRKTWLLRPGAPGRSGTRALGIWHLAFMAFVIHGIHGILHLAFMAFGIRHLAFDIEH